MSHVNAQPLGQKRWFQLSETHKNIDVHLISPRCWKSNYFGNTIFYPQSNVDKNNFHISTLPVFKNGNDSFYLFVGLLRQLLLIRPDIIYVIGMNLSMLHCIILKKLFLFDAKIVVFTMSAPEIKPNFPTERKNFISNLVTFFLWKLSLKFADGFVCHYPDLRNNIVNMGYSKSILVQTQIGVDECLYKRDFNFRSHFRSENKFDGFVIGFVGRIAEFKGIFDLLEATKYLRLDVKLLIVGDGPELDKFKARVFRTGLINRVLAIGYVSPYEVPQYMSAMDCLFVGSRSTKDWVDTFPNVVAQAMVLGLPVIGSTCGAIPYMINDPDLIFKEGDITELVEKINKLIDNPNWTENKSVLLKKRGNEKFSISGLNLEFHHFLLKNYIL